MKHSRGRSMASVCVALVVVWLDRRRHYTKGRALALYVMLYTAGRGWIEALRIDDAHKFLGLRLNDWTSVLVFVAAVGYFVVMRPKDSDDDHDPDPLTSAAPTLTP